MGTEFFPDADESQFSIILQDAHRHPGQRTEMVTARIENTIKRVLKDARAKAGAPAVRTVISDTGLPVGRSAVFSPNTGPHAGNLNVNLVPKVERAVSDEQLADQVRQAVSREFPGTQAYFFIGGIVKRILNFGSPPPIDIEVVGYDLEDGGRYSNQLRRACGGSPTSTASRCSPTSRSPGRRTTPSST